MRYAITGATGFVGGELVRQLREAGHDVAALVRDPTRAGKLSDLGVELVAGGLSDAAALRRLCEGSDGMFHVAGWYKLGSRRPAEAQRVNVDGTRNALTAAAQAGVARVVYTSTLAVNSDTRGRVVDESYRFSGKHLSVYDQTKAAAHDVALQFAADGLPLVVVMPGLVYGPGDTSQSGALIRRVAAGRRVVVPAKGGVCWGYIADIAAGHTLAMQRGNVGESYMLAGPRATLADGLRRAAAIAGTKPPISLPNAMVRATAWMAGPFGRVLPADYATESLRASVATYYGTPDKAKTQLGWVRRDIDEGLHATLGR